MEEASNIHVALNHKFHTGPFWQVHSCIDPVYLWIKPSICFWLINKDKIAS